ncbi:MAG: hypothetical protein JNJ44_03160 [Zoogloeaceae bacterium]|nr:hypothetical protein [Zoogloeaceae bacterium]
MTPVVIVTFGKDQAYEITLHAEDSAEFTPDSARAWLAEEFEALECTPSNPMGKILAVDMILNVAKYGGEARFATGTPWARRFAAATAAVLDRPVIAVDVPGFTVG